MKKLLPFLLLLISLNALADVGNVTYVPPTLRTNGSQLLSSEIAGFKLYLDKILVQDLPAKATTATVAIVGTQILNMTTIDTDGRESAFSPDISLSGKGLPSYPDVTVTVTIQVRTK